jgi:Mlc titration factor MtfA (ptsG expression regulator)
VRRERVAITDQCKGRTSGGAATHDFYRQTEQMGLVEHDEIIAAAPPAATLLTPVERDRFIAHAERLAGRVRWEAARGFDLTGPMVAAICAHAGYMAAGFSIRTDPFRDITAVIVHAGSFVTTDVVAGPVPGVVSDAPRHLAGQAGSGRGPVVLDWRTAEHEFGHPEQGTNVVFHEFAHKLDQLDGVFDGMPPLGSDAARAEWRQTFGTNYRRLRRRGGDPVVRVYAATNPAEYFAVVSELFFTVPLTLRAEHPRIYARLGDFYHQDPARRYDP